MDDLPQGATWVHASLLIDAIDGNKVGGTARSWLSDRGTPPADVDRIIALARRDVDASARTPIAALSGARRSSARPQRVMPANVPRGRRDVDQAPPAATDEWIGRAP